jgi:opacity protein-like surface antigen
MKPAALTAVVALCLSASAFAQQETRNDREYRNVYSDLTVGIQNTIPGGKAFDDVRWSELISGGIGLDVEYYHLWRANSWVYTGYYAGLSFDSFGGRRSTLTASGVTADVRTDRMNMADLEVGFRVRENFNGFHLDQSVGVGGAIYTKQEFDVMGGASDLELIKSSVNYGFTLGARIGAPLGKDVELNFGVALHINGAPDEGKDVTGLHFKPQTNVVLGLGLDFGF